MGHDAIRYAVYSQVSIHAGLVACYLMLPFVLHGPEGISNYGTFWPTVIPYTLGFGLSALLVALAARYYAPRLSAHEAASLRKKLRVLAWLLLAVLLSTYVYKLHVTLDVLHKLLGITLVSWQILLSFHLVRLRRKDTLDLILLAGLLSGALLMAVSLQTPAGYLSTGQVIFAAMFSVVFIRSTIRFHRNDDVEA